ncbi:hypothetical protein [Sphingomonas sp.]|uniref:hypothetical protein n=1 Tax=Sphingomonas sp. TaxID=28214 RepID=UPI0017DBB5DB|nr:hypothetical protein [Sphingomonas sp.]MBA4760616.1 hypothetical protein [Sphingomonas sp.]
MMPLSVSAALDASRGLAVDEAPGSLIVTGAADEAALEAWRTVARDCDALGCRLTCRDDIGDAHDLMTAELAELTGEPLRITLEIAHPANALRVATVDGLRRALADPDGLLHVSEIRLLGLDEPIRTLGVDVVPWRDGDGDAAPRAASAFPSPRRFARTIAGENRAPAEIGSSVLDGSADRQDGAFLLWREFAADAVRRSLVNEIYDVDGATRVVLAGSPTRRLDLGAAEATAGTFAELQQAARWVFVEGQDVELRHTLLTGELAREWRDEQPFAVGLADRLHVALESAGLAYRAHVQQGSRETIKSLSDLRKTLAEEIGKVTQQTRDLSSGLWRDVAVAIVTIAFRLSMDATKSTATPVYAVVLVLVAAYIVVSQVITVKSSRAFLKVAADARTQWRQKGYAYLSDVEFNALAGTPLAEARAIYDRVETAANWVAGSVAAGLVIFAAWEAGMISAGWRALSSIACG